MRRWGLWRDAVHVRSADPLEGERAGVRRVVACRGARSARRTRPPLLRCGLDSRRLLSERAARIRQYRVGRPMSRTGILHSVDAIEMLGEAIAIVEESELLRGERITVQESDGKVYGEAMDVGLSFVADLTGRV